MSKEAPRYTAKDRYPDCNAQLILVGKVHNCRVRAVEPTTAQKPAVRKTKPKAKKAAKR